MYVRRQGFELKSSRTSMCNPGVTLMNNDMRLTEKWRTAYDARNGFETGIKTTFRAS